MIGRCSCHFALMLVGQSQMQDVCLAALHVSTELLNTLAPYAVRFPEKVFKSKTLVREVDVDPRWAHSTVLGRV
jgi:hypothetical protein